MAGNKELVWHFENIVWLETRIDLFILCGIKKILPMQIKIYILDMSYFDSKTIIYR